MRRRAEYRDHVWSYGAGTRALIDVLLLHRHLPFAAVHAALEAMERIGSVNPALVAIEARHLVGLTSSRNRAHRPLAPLGRGSAPWDAAVVEQGVQGRQEKHGSPPNREQVRV